VADDEKREKDDTVKPDKKKKSQPRSSRKKSKNKKDLLADAAVDQMRDFSLREFTASTQKGGDKTEKENSQSQSRPEEAEVAEDKARAAAQKDTPENDDQGDDEEVEDEPKKKELSVDDHKITLSKMEEERLKKIDPAELEEKSFEFEDGSSKIKGVLGVVAVVALLAVSYFFFFGDAAETKVLLSTKPIHADNYKTITPDTTFPLAKRIYIYFVPPHGRLGVNTVHIKIFEEITKAAGKKELVPVAHARRSVDANWRNFNTHFQREYFKHSGRYKLQILSPTGKVLADQFFNVKGP